MTPDHEVAFCRNAPFCTRPADHEGGCEGAVPEPPVMVVSQDFYNRITAGMKPCSECKGQEPLRSDCRRCGGDGVEWQR